MLDDLVAGRIPLSKTLLLFEKFDWQKPSVDSFDQVDGVPPVENSFDEVQVDSRLSARQYAQLADAYRKAVEGGQTSAVGSS